MTDKPKTTAPEPFSQHTELLRLPGPRAEELLAVEGNQEQPLIEKTNNSIAEQEAERNEECGVKTADDVEKSSEIGYLQKNPASSANSEENERSFRATGALIPVLTAQNAAHVHKCYLPASRILMPFISRR